MTVTLTAGDKENVDFVCHDGKGCFEDEEKYHQEKILDTSFADSDEAKTLKSQKEEWKFLESPSESIPSKQGRCRSYVMFVLPPHSGIFFTLVEKSPALYSYLKIDADYFINFPLHHYILRLYILLNKTFMF